MVLSWTGTCSSRVDDERVKEGKRLIFPGLCSQLSCSKESGRNRESEREREREREKERKKDMGIQALMQQRCFNQHGVGIYSVFSSVQFSHSVMSDSLQPHESQHARPPCPSPTPGVYSNSCPSSRWCHPAISSSVVSFSSCRQHPHPQHQGLFQWVNSSHEVAKVLEFQLQHQSFQ